MINYVPILLIAVVVIIVIYYESWKVDMQIDEYINATNEISVDEIMENCGDDSEDHYC